MKPNPQQQKIIDHIQGPCLVTAVPGSGKTATLTERIKNLIVQGVDPSNILAITFTNKAAQEMRSRIAKTVGAEPASRMTVRTFHSMCAVILRHHGTRLGLHAGFSIYDRDDQERMMRMCVVKYWDVSGVVKKSAKKPEDDFVKEIVEFVELQRNHCLTDAEALTKSNLQNDQYDIAQLYHEEMLKANAVDFTGLLNMTLRLFKEHPSVLKRFQDQWKFISVDEVQDTNVVQYELIKMLGEHGNVLMVGDLDQSIYRFRGANPENLLTFEKDFSPYVLKLENNYRSTPEILKHAHKLICCNKLRKETELKTGNPSGPLPAVMRYYTDEEMAAHMADKVFNLIHSGENPSEIAIFYRVNHVSRILEKALRHRRIKYKVVGGTSFWDRKEVKIGLAILKLMTNPNDRTSFERAIEYCCKGVGTRTIAKIFDDANSSGKTIMEVGRERSAKNDRMGNNMRSFFNCVAPGRKPDHVLRSLMFETAFGDKLRKESRSDNDRQANVMELASDATSFVDEGGKLDAYLQQISLISSADEKGQNQEVLLMTMHACKGLEFDNVFISHANGGVIPHKRCMEVEDQEERTRQIEEERRLFYVAMTRASRRLSICCCDAMGYGGNNQSPSAFIRQAELEIKRVSVPPWMMPPIKSARRW